MSERSSVFSRELAARQPAPEAPDGRPRTWCFVPYDQLSDRLGLLAERDPREVGIVLVENPGKAARRPYHRQKLALVLANLRQFALEQAGRGVAVRHLVADKAGYAGALEQAARALGPLIVHEPAERELRVELAPLLGTALRSRPHTGWLTTEDQFRRSQPAAPPWRMDAFYRLVRRELDLLMERGKPVGGKLSFDDENRERYRGQPAAPQPPRFAADAITREVAALIEQHYASHPGQVDLPSLPSTAADAEALWAWALRDCLPTFGPFEDAMSRASSGLFHSRISALLNLHRLLPARVLRDVVAAPIPLASKEGFVRQLVGWREYVRHVHRGTDGFRRVPGLESPDAAPSFLAAQRPLPPAYWGAPSGLACLDHVVADVWREAYSHHITRLMVLGNLATLLDVSPRQLTDWFWVAYTDAYDWVVEPNVLGMATFAAGDVMTTKPYIAGAAYLERMSDYCKGCRFHPKKTCPITPLYWAFLDRHAARLAGNPRMTVPLAALRKRSPERRAADAATFARVSRQLTEGREVAPDHEAVP
jgi:deoxyribodipyrimidine photolyase-related protein